MTPPPEPDEGDRADDEGAVHKLPFGEGERRLLVGLCASLRELLVDGSDPSLVRLRPTAYVDDPEQERAWQLLARSELDDHRLVALDTVEGGIERRQVTDAELQAWLTTLNALRLVLGTQLGVSDDEDEADLDGPDGDRWAVYEWLGGALSWVIHEHRI